LIFTEILNGNDADFFNILKISIGLLTPLDDVTGWTDLKDVLITQQNYFFTKKLLHESAFVFPLSTLTLLFSFTGRI
jgi:hypothetical protein